MSSSVCCVSSVSMILLKNFARSPGASSSAPMPWQPKRLQKYKLNYSPRMIETYFNQSTRDYLTMNDGDNTMINVSVGKTIISPPMTRKYWQWSTSHLAKSQHLSVPRGKLCSNSSFTASAAKFCPTSNASARLSHRRCW